ncbi:acyl carrier protein [Micromonospora sp. C51]|uniref:acyl carrier protein n=1 Tax=Micromonospora sp. C51 TaxID=2824879 RepID=UPI001B3857F2|nr:phosphopantetheine-binding protein [Micromonospora sp. C51]MBQ1050174.1 acyl carrier protein [Micromonospora sp. C51]
MPSGETLPPEALLAEVLVAATEVFGKPVKATDNFFDLQGDSLHALELTARLADRLGVDVDLDVILEADDFASLATTIGESLSARNSTRAGS